MSGGRLRTGKMRHRITLQNPVVTEGDFGADNITYVDARKIWAEIESKGSRELMIADQFVAIAVYKIYIRWAEGLTEQSRVKFGDNIFNIESIENPDFVKRKMILTVSQDRSERGDGTIV